MPLRVAINGFGRIGRILYRAYLRSPSPNLEFVAANDIVNASTMAHLLKYDSIHGKLQDTVSVEGSTIKVGSKKLQTFMIKDPAQLPWKDLKIDVVVESTGLFTERESTSKHLAAGARKVIISAPAKGPDATIIPGVTNDVYDPKKHIILSIGSCTTNCVVPCATVLHKNFGIDRAYMITTHAYTNDQRLHDLQHRDLRRARAAALSIIPTTTGAARTVGEVIPELKGKIDGMALRVPVADVSVLNLVATLKRDTTKEEVNEVFIRAADGELRGILKAETEPTVSADYLGDTHSAVVDTLSTVVVDKRLVNLTAFYDNEMGFSFRMLDMLDLIAKKG
ncbi:MAG: type I glyceraldehyde-3-phosphate dehydrogenase [Thermoproteota archaeon]